MNSQSRLYGSGYSDFVNSFHTEELEEFLFGYLPHSSSRTAFWDWVNTPSSMPPSPALATLSKASSPSPSLEELPKAAMAFYAFIEGEYNPRLFVPDPFNHFLGKEASASSAKDMRTLPVSQKKTHRYFLRPHDSTGRVITSRQLY
ncbi:hypothetical protein O181_123296 [Austropuccinia psidii MF-1]|uniref:Uncharacterized protein n=1 Tax=Austropuccinia psidii MF-1 TaxID=1389203 RepID=A0A9Q3Q353_9BASI|nr:hypothetical protein [Austropuccinia psidii MF-1]